jgi:hypothetical protein
MSSNGEVQFVPYRARFQCWPTRTGFEGLEELEPASIGVVLGATLGIVRSSRWPVLAGYHAAENLVAVMFPRPN